MTNKFKQTLIKLLIKKILFNLKNIKIRHLFNKIKIKTMK